MPLIAPHRNISVPPSLAEQGTEESTQPARVHVRRPRRDWLKGFLLACLVALIASGFSFAADAAFDAPWAYALPGGPTLTGTWEGGFRTLSGVQFGVFLELHRPVLASGTPQMENYRGALLSGRANWCDSQGRKAAGIPILGAVPTFTGFNGTADHVEIDLQNPRDLPNGLIILNLRGSWKGDALTLQPMFAEWNGSTFVYSSDSPDIKSPITIVLRKVRYDAFPAACGTLKGGAAP